MRMAPGIRAARFVLNRVNNAQRSAPIGISENVRALLPAKLMGNGAVELLGLPLTRMTGAASLGVLINAREEFAFVSRGLNLAGLIENANLLDTRLRTYRAEDLIDFIAAVVEHPVTGAALYGFGDSIAGSISGFFEVLTMQPNYFVSKSGKNDHNSAD
jgi:hypothetical protein